MRGLLANCGLTKHEALGGACAMIMVVRMSPNLRSLLCAVGFFVSLQGHCQCEVLTWDRYSGAYGALDPLHP